MSYWFADDLPASKPAGKRMVHAPTHFNNEADVALFYPPVPTKTIRRTKAGGENVKRTAMINDRRERQIEVNKEHDLTQQLAKWHSHCEFANVQGQRKRNQKQMVEDYAVARQELTLLRRSKLKKLLEDEYQQHKKELAAKGLAIIYDEPFYKL